MSEAPTEAEIEREPDAVAGLALLEERLARCSEEEVAAFWKAVRLCYGARSGDDPADHCGGSARPPA